jgi:antitoxin (DNA-binding transcriptional repressor) of toxin-antitoxin stability system
VPDVTATDAARNFADLLDAIEHRHERYTIMRRGRAVAQLEPVSRGRGADLKALLRRHEPDAKWSSDLTEVRELLTLDDRE